MNTAEHGLPPSDTLASPPDVSTAIERLLANPELLSSVASAIGLGKASPEPASDALPDTVSASASPEPTPSPPPSQNLGESVAALAPLLSALSGKQSAPTPNDPRACLLCALKPYVSRGRAEAIDTIINLSRVSELLKNVDLTRRS